MSGPDFRFCEFSLKQENSAWKVGTDSILLGSWIHACKGGRILDIGTGTGILALMVAQKSPDSELWAIEVDPESHSEAADNFRESPWSDRIYSVNEDFFAWPAEGMIFDLIITNPPYFDVKTGVIAKGRKSIARQGRSFNLMSLPARVEALLSETGMFSCILPAEFFEPFVAECNANGLYAGRICKVHSRKYQSVERHLYTFSRKLCSPEIEELILYHDGGMTQAFQELTRMYYRDIDTNYGSTLVSGQKKSENTEVLSDPN